MSLKERKIQAELNLVESIRKANHVFDGLRCRVEKLIAKVAMLGLFHNGKCRLGYRMLLATVKLSMHTAAVWSRLHPQYDGYGDWAHF